MQDRARANTAARLAFVVAASIVPAVLIAMLLVGYDYYDRERDRLARDSLGTARALSAAVENELTGVKAALLALATSPHLGSGDLAAFHGQALAALKDQSFANIVLIDASNQQRLNTLRRYGEPLPADGNPPALERIFQTGETVITDLFTGPVVKKHYIAIGVPVLRGGKIVYSLNGGIDPQSLSALLSEQRLPPGWVAVILDRRGTIVARTREPERWVGQKGSSELVQRIKEAPEAVFEAHTVEGIRVLTVFSRSPLSGWTVAIGIPMAELESHLWFSLARLFLAAFIAVLAGMGIAFLFGRRLVR